MEIVQEVFPDLHALGMACLRTLELLLRSSWVALDPHSKNHPISFTPWPRLILRSVCQSTLGRWHPDSFRAIGAVVAGLKDVSSL